MQAPDGLVAWRDRMRADPVRHAWLKVLVGITGALMMVAAALTGWLPGPGGIPLFLLGLAVWATEFGWAHGLLHRVKEFFDAFVALPAWGKWAITVGCLALAALCWWGWAAWQGLPGWLPERAADWAARLPHVERD